MDMQKIFKSLDNGHRGGDGTLMADHPATDYMKISRERGWSRQETVDYGLYSEERFFGASHEEAMAKVEKNRRHPGYSGK